MTAAKPMDPERLARFRDDYSDPSWLIPSGEARDYVRDLLADRDYHAALLLGLLAVIHRDGGQHTDAVGLEQSVVDAQARWLALHEEIERAGGLLVDEQQSARHYATELAAALAKLAMSEADRDRHAQRADIGERQLDRYDTLGAELAMTLGEDDPHHPLDMLAACVMTALRAARAEVARLRARVRVEAEDVGRAGVTWHHVVAWLRANEWSQRTGRGLPHGPGGSFVHWTRSARRGSTPDCVCVYEHEHGENIANAIGSIARHHARPGLDILDEMAATEVPG